MWIQDKLPSYWNLCKINEQTFHFTTHFGIQDRQLTFHFIPQIGIYATQADGLTTKHFIPHIGIYGRQTDKLRFISSLILNISYWDANMTDRRINPHFPHIVGFFTNRRRIIGRQTTFHFKPHKMTKDRRTDYISFHPSYWDPRNTDRRTYYASFYPPIWIYATQTENYVSFHPYIGI